MFIQLTDPETNKVTDVETSAIQIVRTKNMDNFFFNLGEVTEVIVGGRSILAKESVNEIKNLVQIGNRR